jgi:hypothetical protein
MTATDLPLTAEERDSLKRLAEKATPGPWRTGSGDWPFAWGTPNREGDVYAERIEGRHRYVELISGFAGELEEADGDTPKTIARQLVSSREEDAAFIAALDPQTVLRLLADVERAEKDAAHWKDQFRRLRPEGWESAEVERLALLLVETRDARDAAREDADRLRAEAARHAGHLTAAKEGYLFQARECDELRAENAALIQAGTNLAHLVTRLFPWLKERFAWDGKVPDEVVGEYANAAHEFQAAFTEAKRPGKALLEENARLQARIRELDTLLVSALPGDAGHVERLAAGREVEREAEERRVRAEETR